jgi:hypothetical protein
MQPVRTCSETWTRPVIGTVSHHEPRVRHLPRLPSQRARTVISHRAQQGRDRGTDRSVALRRSRLDVPGLHQANPRERPGRNGVPLVARSTWGLASRFLRSGPRSARECSQPIRTRSETSSRPVTDSVWLHELRVRNLPRVPPEWARSIFSDLAQQGRDRGTDRSVALRRSRLAVPGVREAHPGECSSPSSDVKHPCNRESGPRR